MPKEHVYGNVVTVPDGDLPVMRARTRAELEPSAVDERVLDGLATVRDRVDVLRRRHDLLREFTSDVDSLLDEATRESAPNVVDRLRARHGGLIDRLRDLPLGSDAEVNLGGDLAHVRLVPGERAVVRAAATDAARPAVARSRDRLEHDAVAVEVDREVTTDPAAAGETQLQLRVALGWERDGGHVVLGVEGYDHARGRAVDLGGLRLTLDWTGCNRLIAKLRVARDQSHGAPE